MKQIDRSTIVLVPCRKKPMVVHCAQINEPFQVEAIEGLLTGQAGDYLMRGVEGEFYICAKHIFEKTYELV